MQQQEMFLWDKLEPNFAPHKNVLPPLAGSQFFSFGVFEITGFLYLIIYLQLSHASLYNFNSMKKKRKYQKAPEKPNKTCYIRIRVTEEQYNTLLERAKKSSYKNLSAWGRHRLLSDKSTSVALTDEERQFLEGLLAARIDIVRFSAAVDAATKDKPDEFRKKYILSLGAQRIWSPAVNRVFNFIYDFLETHNYDCKR